MLRKLVYTCIFIALYCPTMIQTAERPSSLEVYNVTCHKDTERIKRFECEFQKSAINRYVINGRIMFDRDMSKTFQTRIWCDIVPKNFNKVIRMLDVRLNTCSFLQYGKSNLLLKSFLTEFTRSTNLPTSCPFKGNFLYKQENFTLASIIIPSAMPSFSFTFTAEFFERNKLFGGFQAVGAKVN